MRATSKLLALALTAALQPAMAGVVLLDFEDVQTQERLTDRYLGSKGVTASGAAWTARSSACTPDNVDFARAGSCGALWLAKDPTDPSGPTGKIETLTLTLNGGFDALSFIYAGGVSAIALQVHVYDAAGKELGQGISGLTGSPCTGYVYCNWTDVSSQQPNGPFSFQGTAYSVTFAAFDQTVVLDDIRFRTPTVGGRLPEPGSIALALGGLGALGWTRKRAAR